MESFPVWTALPGLNRNITFNLTNVLTEISIENFKRIPQGTLQLDRINVLVGGNNAGKSCYLQAAHFGVMLSQSQNIAGTLQFPAEKLRYCPTDDFLNLRHGSVLRENHSVDFLYKQGIEESAEIKLKRGRNGVVRAEVTGNALLGLMADPALFFSIYVPGLAGITIREEYRSDLVVNNGIARGDANLYLRNVLLRIYGNADRRARFDQLLNEVFPNFTVTTTFNFQSDLFIYSKVRLPSGEDRPLDTIGTGFLQAVQLLAYVTNYSPRLLLLDEPDAHLNPGNQRLLARVLSIIARESDTQVILATHSRHLIDSLSDVNDARLFWVRDGSVQQQETWSDVSVLMDLGALDRGEQFLAGDYEYLIWTEDEDMKFIKTLFHSNGFPEDRTLFFSYRSSSKTDAAAMLVSFMTRIRPAVRLIIHRDRDFMTDDEIQRLNQKYRLQPAQNCRLFVTEKSDIESYFVRPDYIAAISGISPEDAQALIDNAVQQNNIDFAVKFRDKREAIKQALYREDPDACPATNTFIHGAIIPTHFALGKMLLSKVNFLLQQGRLPVIRGIVQNDSLLDEDIVNLRL